MATEQYAYAYTVTNVSGNLYEIVSDITAIAPATVAESNDTDLQYAVFETVTVTYANLGGNPSYTYVGVWEGSGTSFGAGSPMFLNNGTSPAQYIILSNTPYTVGDQYNVSGVAYANCLAPGALIRTACQRESVFVEDIAIGDLVLTPSGPRAVRFIGRNTRTLHELRATGRMPIRIEAGALGELGPEAPIHCTPSHAFLIGGCLVEAQALINGTTIRQLESWEEPTVTYYSIELEEHGLVWANGLLTETYFANVRGKGFSRESWDNHADYVALYGEGEPMQELELPRIPFARQLPAEIRQLAGVPDPAEAEAALYALN